MNGICDDTPDDTPDDPNGSDVRDRDREEEEEGVRAEGAERGLSEDLHDPNEDIFGALFGASPKKWGYF
jgi:hypothetical protein